MCIACQKIGFLRFAQGRKTFGEAAGKNFGHCGESENAEKNLVTLHVH